MVSISETLMHRSVVHPSGIAALSHDPKVPQVRRYIFSLKHYRVRWQTRALVGRVRLWAVCDT